MGNRMLEEFYEHLDRLDKTGKKFAIWGAGWTGKTVKEIIADYSSCRLKEECTVDNNPSLWGIDNIISPDVFFERKDIVDTVFVCVYVADEVVGQLKENGYKGNIIPVSSSIMASDTYLKWYVDNKENIDNLFYLLSDQRSIDTVKTFYEVAKTGDISLWENVNGKSKYKTLEPDILRFSKHERMVEVGAFTGDTTHCFLDACGGEYDSILGLEPDPFNFKALHHNYSVLKNAKALEFAAGNKECEMGFAGGLSESGFIDENGDVRVRVVRLDSLPEAQKATFIKLSANGYELAALMGAEEIIKNNRPKLAYYCGGGHLWNIPMFLKTLVPEYKLYIRHYGIGMQAMVGYAVI